MKYPFRTLFMMTTLGLAVLHAVETPPATTPPANPAPKKRLAPEILPGNGLAQHDFFYAGESKRLLMYIVRKGQIVWSYEHPTKGEISDAVLMSNGNILFAHQFGLTLITSEKKVLWNYDAPPHCEIHTAQPIGKDRVIFIQNGPEPKIIVMNIVTGKTEKEIPLAVGNTSFTHGQFRHARLTDKGTYLVCHFDKGKVSEYDENGKEVWTVDASPIWAAERLKSGNTLISGNKKFVREVNPKGETVWELVPGDLPDYKIDAFQTAISLPNGNILVNNYANPPRSQLDPNNAPVQALELTKDKKVVWAIRAWTPPADLGPSTTIQILDEPGVPEDVHFGNIK